MSKEKSRFQEREEQRMEVAKYIMQFVQIGKRDSYHRLGGGLFISDENVEKLYGQLLEQGYRPSVILLKVLQDCMTGGQAKRLHNLLSRVNA